MQIPFLQFTDFRSSHQTITKYAMSSPAPQPIVHWTEDKYTEKMEPEVPAEELEWLWKPLCARFQEISTSVLSTPNALVEDAFSNTTASTPEEILQKAEAWLVSSGGSSVVQAALVTICADLTKEQTQKAQAAQPRAK
jgi:hypothetical protein